MYLVSLIDVLLAPHLTVVFACKWSEYIHLDISDLSSAAVPINAPLQNGRISKYNVQQCKIACLVWYRYNMPRYHGLEALGW